MSDESDLISEVKEVSLMVDEIIEERDKMRSAIYEALLHARVFYEQERELTSKEYDDLVDIISKGLEEEKEAHE